MNWLLSTVALCALLASLAHAANVKLCYDMLYYAQYDPKGPYSQRQGSEGDPVSGTTSDVKFYRYAYRSGGKSSFAKQCANSDTPDGTVKNAIEIRQSIDGKVTVVSGDLQYCVPKSCGYPAAWQAFEALISNETVIVDPKAASKQLQFKQAFITSWTFPAEGDAPARVMPLVTSEGPTRSVCNLMSSAYSAPAGVNERSTWVDYYTESCSYGKTIECKPAWRLKDSKKKYESLCRSYAGHPYTFSWQVRFANQTIGNYHDYLYCIPSPCSRLDVNSILQSWTEAWRSTMEDGSAVVLTARDTWHHQGETFVVESAPKLPSCSNMLFKFDSPTGPNNVAVKLKYMRKLVPAQHCKAVPISPDTHLTYQNCSIPWINFKGWKNYCSQQGGFPMPRVSIFESNKQIFVHHDVYDCMPNSEYQCSDGLLNDYLQNKTDSDMLVPMNGADDFPQYIIMLYFNAQPFRSREGRLVFASGGIDCSDQLVLLHAGQAGLNSMATGQTYYTMRPLKAIKKFAISTAQDYTTKSFKDDCGKRSGSTVYFDSYTLNNTMLNLERNLPLCVPILCRVDTFSTETLREYMEGIARSHVEQKVALYQERDVTTQGVSVTADSGLLEYRETSCRHMVEASISDDGSSEYGINTLSYWKKQLHVSFQTVKQWDETSINATNFNKNSYKTLEKECRDTWGSSVVSASDVLEFNTGSYRLDGNMFFCHPRMCSAEGLRQHVAFQLPRKVSVPNVVYAEMQRGDVEGDLESFYDPSDFDSCITRLFLFSFDLNHDESVAKSRDVVCTNGEQCVVSWKDGAYDRFVERCFNISGDVLSFSYAGTREGREGRSYTNDSVCVPTQCSKDTSFASSHAYWERYAMRLRRRFDLTNITLVVGSLVMSVPKDACYHQFRKMTANQPETRKSAGELSDKCSVDRIGPKRDWDLIECQQQWKADGIPNLSSLCASEGGQLHASSLAVEFANSSVLTWSGHWCVPAVCNVEVRPAQLEHYMKTQWMSTRPGLSSVPKFSQMSMGSAETKLGNRGRSCARQFNLFDDLNLNVDFKQKYRRWEHARFACQDSDPTTRVCESPFKPGGRKALSADCMANNGRVVAVRSTITYKNFSALYVDDLMCVPNICMWRGVVDSSVSFEIQRLAERLLTWMDLASLEIVLRETPRSLAVLNPRPVAGRASWFPKTCTMLLSNLTEEFPGHNGLNSNKGKDAYSVEKCDGDTCMRQWTRLENFTADCSSYGSVYNFSAQHTYSSGKTVHYKNDFFCVPSSCLNGDQVDVKAFIQMMADDALLLRGIQRSRIMIFGPNHFWFARTDCDEFDRCSWDDNSLSAGAIAAIVVCTLVGAAALAFLSYFYVCRRGYSPCWCIKWPSRGTTSSTSKNTDALASKLIKAQI